VFRCRQRHAAAGEGRVQHPQRLDGLKGVEGLEASRAPSATGRISERVRFAAGPSGYGAPGRA
jgi:hypothetical protein